MNEITLRSGARLTQEQIKRTGALPAHVIGIAADIIERVRAEGDAAIRELELTFDKVELPADYSVDRSVMEAAWESISPELQGALNQAAAQIRNFHENQKQTSWMTYRQDGTALGVKVTPLDSVGIYVPGGRAQYPSTVLMNAIPAKVAGVERIVMTTPPQPDGTLTNQTLAAAYIAGVDVIYTVGGAQAIAALAYGTDLISPVAKVTGPGNAFVAAAKKLVNGDVGIDMVAGPSEVCVLADEHGDSRIVAMDLMAQAEHDPMASTYLITTQKEFAQKVKASLEDFIPDSPRQEITRASIDNNFFAIICEDIDTALEAVNFIAPEHLEIQLSTPEQYVGRIRNAGAIFLGTWSCEALGDYVAGPNHTLPTSGTARYSSPLSVEDFIKKSSIIHYTYEGLLADVDAVSQLSQSEGLWAHGRSCQMRVELHDQITGKDVK